MRKSKGGKGKLSNQMLQAKASICLAVAGVAGFSFSQRALAGPTVSYSVVGSSYQQNFNTLGSTNSASMALTTAPPGTPFDLTQSPVSGSGLAGWYGEAQVGGTGPNLVYRIDDGGSTTGALYSYGVTTNSNRALGSVASGTTIPEFGAVFTNTTGSTLGSITITFDGEEWRNGGSNNTNTLTFSYSIGSNTIDTSGGTFLTDTALNYVDTVHSATATAGTTAPLGITTGITDTITGLNWANGTTLAIRWADANDAGNDDGIAIDNFSLSAQLAPVTHVFVWNNKGSGWNTAGNWTPPGPPSASTPTAINIASFDPTVKGSSVINPVISGSSNAASALNLNNNFEGGTYSFTGTGKLAVDEGGVTVRGIGTQTMSFGDGASTSLTITPTGSNSAIDIGHGAGLTLTGNTIVSAGTAPITLRGGTLTIDNSTGTPAGGQTLSTSGNVNMTGGGSTLVFNGASGGSNFTGLSGALSTVAGASNVVINEPNGATGGTSVTFGSLTRGTTMGTINFTNTGLGTLGGGGPTDPSILFTTAPLLGPHGNIVSSSATSSIPFAIVTTTSNGVTSGTFANYGAHGIVAATLTTRDQTTINALGNTATSAENTNYAPTANGTLTGSITTQSLTINPQGDGLSLNLGANTINTSGLILSGGHDFTITGTAANAVFGTQGGAGNDGNGTHTLWVANPTTTLFVSAPIGSSGNGTASGPSPVTFAGPGFLDLTGATDQLAFVSSPAGTTVNVNIAGGTLEATTTSYQGPGTTLNLRGGVFELVGGGSFTRSLGIGTGQVSWATPGATSGSGGFSALNGALTVNIGNAATPDTLTWGGQTVPNDAAGNSQASFVQDGSALIFGSTKSNSVVTFRNPIALDSGTPGIYAAREIEVIGGVGGDKTVMTGAISGSSSTDLIKTGAGTLQLAATNTYQGSTLVYGGTLNITGSIVNNSSNNVLIASGPAQATFGAIVSRATGAGASYDGIGSRIMGDLNTSADILRGKNSTNNPNAESITMQWRTRAVNETVGTATYPPADPTSFGLISDVVRITGMANTGTSGSGFTDPFALQMSYLAQGTSETSEAALGYIHIDWLDPNGAAPGVAEWQNAIDGDDHVGGSVTAADLNVQESLTAFLAANNITDANIGNFLGSWGVDTSTHTSWAIVDHNSDFAVVPEPSSAVGLVAIAGLTLMTRRRRRTAAN